MYEINVSVAGISPLLFNRFIQAELESKSKKQSGADNPEQVFIGEAKNLPALAVESVNIKSATQRMSD